MAARSRSVGRYDLVVEVAKSQLGPLWIGTGLGSGGLEPRYIRCVAVGPSTTPRDVAALADVGRWCSGFDVEQALGTLDVVSTERELALIVGYAPGETLRSLLRLANVKREPIPTPVALRLTLDVCRALAAAATRAEETAREPGFLWGGLLPDSILVGTDGVARVLDLGVAPAWRQLSVDAQQPEVVAYSAPEQLGGRVAASSDVFTLGTLLWEMLSGGKRLFGGAQRAIIEKLQKLSVPPVAPGSPGEATDADTRALLSTMLEPDSERRLPSVLELERVLAALGDRVAPPGEVADFVQRLAQQSLESRERVLARALQRKAAEAERRPASEPPPHPDAALAKSARPEAPGLAAAKPLPLPAQVKLGARLSESRLPPPPPLRALVEVDTRASDDDDAASVKAEDIMAALAIEDLEPETDENGPAPEPEPAAEVDTPGPARTSSPTSSRRAPLTAVVVPSVMAGPDAPTLTPVPSVLETLRGQGFEFADGELGLEHAEMPVLATAAQPAPIAAALAVSVAEPPPVPTKGRGKLEPGALGLLVGARQRVSTSLVAAVGGTLVLLLIAVAATGGGGAATTPTPAPENTNLRADNGADVGRQIDAEARRETADERIARADTPKLAAALADPGARDEARVEGSGGPPVAPNGVAAPNNPATATLAAAPAVAAPRAAAAPRPARRSSAIARTGSPAAKKKKLRATKTYIPAGI